MRRVLGLDFGVSSLGWAVVDERGGVLAHGVWKLAASDEGRASEDRQHREGKRWLRLESLVEEALNAHDVAVVAYEKVWRHRSHRDAHAYGAQQAVVQMACAARGLDLESVAFATLKKTATGSGTGKKADVIAATKDVLGVDVGKDHNIADAIWCAETCRRRRWAGKTAAQMVEDSVDG